jgi:RNA polymerase sigma factor (TIGR02999 family)
MEGVRNWIVMAPDDDERLTRQLNRTDTSGRSRWKRVAPLVDRELRKLAAVALRQFSAVNWRHTLQPEELVSEFYLRLLHADGRHWENRKHFFSYASTVMRSILIDRHRARKVSKRPPASKGRALEGLLASEVPAYSPAVRATEIGLALERLQVLSPRQAQIIDLRFFAGMEIAEISAQLELSEKTVQRDWIAARAFLYAELSGLHPKEEAP